mgnify:CR=1 FL=1
MSKVWILDREIRWVQLYDLYIESMFEEDIFLLFVWTRNEVLLALQSL